MCLKGRLAVLTFGGFLERVYDLTQVLDMALGPELDVNKCVREVACSVAGALRAADRDPQAGALLYVRRVVTFRYVGNDL